MHVDLTWPDGTSPARVIERNVLDRGIVLHVCGSGTRFTLHEPVRIDVHTASTMASSPLVSLSLSVSELTSSATTLPLEPNVAIFRLSIPHEGDASSQIGGRGTVHLDGARAERGATISGTFDADVTMTPARIHARGRFRTFVRDIITSDDEACGAPLDEVP